ncbi:Xyloglucan endotransglucosylase/hydrolase [Rhynchospora pubera]|uniref:Xyloglucan endotransglucosylase/hydrolase n=1 Tax=Rhynchospora pubera TaxID=906938 RepID=A0AAV8GW81_9POAL|nr:Xyloglucan endotransglucosylase/hydrolase [Rhynchospora pubera]KAJ4809794.1 Xyloglucan endotransglucosylase/hydrolase [Rhynchospora pubera]
MTSPFVLGTPNSHDEIDFEFLGNVSGQPITIHTNVFVLGNGSREQQFMPWFDPSADFHSYGIFWSPYVIMWSVDGTVIRVFRNWESKGLPFANKQPMRILCSIWNGDYWATENGQVKINWANAPFTSRYTNYRADVCVISKGGNDVERCTVPNRNNWFVEPAYGKLSADQIEDLMRVRRDYMVYDYCTDTKRFNGTMPPECSLPIY